MIARRLLAVLLGLALLTPVALVTAGPATAATAATAAAAAAGTSVTVVQFNTADGKACRSRCLAPIVGLLGRADVVTLQEVCENDLNSFAQAHSLKKTFSPQSTADPVCGNHDRGNAVLSRYALEPITPVVLTAPTSGTSNRFTLLCANVSVPGQRVRACSTHLISAKSADQPGQAQQIVDATASARQQGKRVIVAGDFNARLGDRTVQIMNQAFNQQQPAGLAVLYVWFSSNGFSSITSSTASGGTSDHSVLISTANV